MQNLLSLRCAGVFPVLKRLVYLNRGAVAPS